MKLPKTMVINGERWRVVRKPLWKQNLMGQCCRDKRLIEVCSSLTGTELADTFLHEVMHACAGPTNDYEMEESFVNRTTPTLLAALQGLGWVKL